MTTSASAESVPIGQFDVERARRETPGADVVVHLNNAGAGVTKSGVSAAAIEDRLCALVEGPAQVLR
jgi:hypothetical protein